MRTKTRERPARRPSQKRAVVTVDAILEAAARILEREGLGRGFTTNRIARDAGVGIGSLYEYFDGKDAILRALGERHVTRVRALIDDAFVSLHAAPLDVAIAVVIDALFALHAARPALQRTLQRDFPGRFGPESYFETDRYVETMLAAWLAARHAETPAEVLAARAFVAVRAARVVTIQAFAEGLTEPALTHVREAMKLTLARSLAG